MKISDERCFMLWCGLTAAREDDITVYLNRQSVQGAPYDDITIGYGNISWITLGTVIEIDDSIRATITKNGEAVKGVPGRFGTMYGGFQPGDLVSIEDPPVSGEPGTEA